MRARMLSARTRNTESRCFSYKSQVGARLPDTTLIAVSATSNRSKGDQDPVSWQPPAAGYRCTYATDWIALKTR